MKKILAIDDNKDNLISLSAIIKDVFPDSKIYTATSGSKGIELALTEDPDVILLDILMPQMDGFEVCHCLKRDNRLRDIPVVFLTAIKQSKESRIEALEAGAEAFLSKPIDIPELTAQIKAMVKIKVASDKRRDEKERLASLVLERTYELEKSNSDKIRLLDELAISENRYRKLFEYANDGILIVNVETEMIVNVNQSLIKMLGMPSDQLIGKKVCDIGDLLNIPNTRISFAILRDKGYSRHEDIPFKTLDGQQIHVEVVSNFYSSDNVNVIQINVRDITKRVEAEDRIKTLGKAIEQGPSSIVITNENGEIEFVNKKFTSLTQYLLEDVKGRTPRVFNRGHMPEEEFDKLWETLQKGYTWKGEVQNRKKDCTTYWEETIISTIMNPDKSICNYILIMNDITEKRKIMDDLIAAKEKAEESDRLKTAFLANMSHEIRTPLNCIIGFSDLMLEPDFDLSKQNEFVRMIYDSGINMLSMITDILDLSKIEAGQISLKKDVFSVNQLVANLQNEFLFKAEEKGIELRLDILNPKNDIKIYSDEEKLKQILANLVSNALKFSKEGFVEIGFEAMENDIQFHVQDTGIGINENFHYKIFERFCQVESDYTREYGGNGLGLSISKSLVEILGGNIWVESGVGEGSIFYFTMPAYSGMNNINMQHLAN